jgi:phosphoglucosamine mutase
LISHVISPNQLLWSSLWLKGKIMDRKYFGTDGIRGLVGKYPITAEFVLKLGWAVGSVLSRQEGGGKVVIGKDTRISNYMFESALEAGLSAAGTDVYLLGPIPTPGIAHMTRTLRADIGIVISASHNSYLDNGIKFFSGLGLKLNDALEIAIEQQIDKPLVTVSTSKLGKAYRVDDSLGRYVEFCKSSVPHRTNFKNLNIIIDCANGATFSAAPQVFTELQANVKTINSNPDGLNINEACGSTNPISLRAQVLQEGADIGIAFDGDGDRVIMIDHKGEIVDGDELLFIIACNKHKLGKLQGGVVGTQMSNMGLELAVNNLGLPFKRTQVGDRYILQTLLEEQWHLGGETSGHIVCLDVTTTGDGIISALQVLQAMQEEQKSLRELKDQMTKFPQVLINLPVAQNEVLLEDQEVKQALSKGESKLKGKGRILLRASGTEPVVRLMVEGEDDLKIHQIASQIAGIIERHATDISRS